MNHAVNRDKRIRAEAAFGKVGGDVAVAARSSAGSGPSARRGGEPGGRSASPRPRTTTAGGVGQLTERGLPDDVHEGVCRAGQS